jgi:3-hydroxyisobutyrate dehydrogenase-like beta-hydroxyacid dehydrogenase
MGSALASRLRLEFGVLGFDVAPAKRAAGAGPPQVRACEQLAELVASSAVVLGLPSPDASLAVVTELAPLMPPGSVVIEASTVNPEHVRAKHAVAAPHRVGLVDAAIAAGVGQARARTALLQAMYTVYELVTADGYGGLDYAAVAKLWKQWLGTSLATKSEDEA